MCRSIKVLRPPYTDPVTSSDVQAAALQYVRKVSGFHRPAAHNQAVFDAAVAAVAEVTADLLEQLNVRGGGARAGGSPRSHAHEHADTAAAG
jgi:hypothetical protein